MNTLNALAQSGNVETAAYEEVQAFARSLDPTRRLQAAKNTALTEDLQALLSKDRNVEVRRALATNPTVAQSILAEPLSTDRDKQVRENVSRNPNTPRPALSSLSKDEELKVRVAVTAHPNTPRELLLFMLADPHLLVSSQAERQMILREGVPTRGKPWEGINSRW